MDYLALGRKIRRYRQNMNLTQDALAEKAHISASFLGHIERGYRKASLDTLVNLANALNTQTDQLLQDSLNLPNEFESLSDTSDAKKAVLHQIYQLFTDYFANEDSEERK